MERFTMKMVFLLQADTRTAGTPIQVYATLQESIDGEVTTRPSAIQRSGTDVTSNDSRLNIPGTPDNLV